MKQLAIILGALLAIGCASSSGTKLQSKTSEGDVVTTYEDPQYGIRLTYPGDWQEQSIPFMMRPKGTIIVLTAPSSVAATKMPPTVSVLVNDITPSEMTDRTELGAMQNHLIDKASKQFADFKLVSADNASLGGEPARRVVYTGSKLGVSLEVLNVIAIHAGRGYAISYTADPEIFAEHRVAVQKLIDSVQWMKK